MAWPSSCSRNAHDQNVLVRRAQSRIDRATLENEMGIGKTLAVEDQSAPIPRENEQAWKEYIYRSMRAVEGSLGHSLARCVKK